MRKLVELVAHSGCPGPHDAVAHRHTLEVAGPRVGLLLAGLTGVLDAYRLGGLQAGSALTRVVMSGSKGWHVGASGCAAGK